MGKIQVLPPHEAQKIAAGEVVERPANVVKEIMENALDAGATQVTVLIEDGGRKRITIIDNGCGMSPEDAQLCILNHATSKLSTVDDLETISTFGFRGEALASIASVSRLTITTKEHDASEGTKFSIEAGEIVATEQVSCNTGTTIDIQDIFYNLPARKKFLKKRETEWHAIHQIFTAFCLDNINYTFALHHDGRQTLHCPAVTTIQERIGQVFDKNLAKEMIESSVEDESIGIKVTGVISRSTYSRYDRNQIVVFVNHRWIKNYKLVQAVIKGYAGILPPRRYPVACIFITIDPLQVDVNIHPRKEEVQFVHPVKVERIIEKMVQQGLDQTLSRDLGNQAPYQHPLGHNYTGQVTKKPFAFGSRAVSSPQTWNFSEQKKSNPQPHTIQQAPTFEQKPVIEVQAPAVQPTYEYQLIGQVHNTYIIIETAEGLVMMDQHAAHERILYELFAERFENVATTQLMFPQLITLSQSDCAVILPHLSTFVNHGIFLEELNDHQLTVKALPVHLKNSNIEELVRATVGWINEFSKLDTIEFAKKINDKLRTMMACKAAIKAGDKLDEKQMHELITKLHTAPNKTTCPHGRPTCWRLALPEIERKFKRDYAS